MKGAYLGEGLEAGLSRHGQIEQEQIWFDCLDHGDRLLAAAGFADDLKSAADIHTVHVLDHRRRRSEQMAQAHAEHAFVVGQHDSHGTTIADGVAKLDWGSHSWLTPTRTSPLANLAPTRTVFGNWIDWNGLA